MFIPSNLALTEYTWPSTEVQPKSIENSSLPSVMQFPSRLCFYKNFVGSIIQQNPNYQHYVFNSTSEKSQRVNKSTK